MLSQLSDDDLEDRFLDIVSSASVTYAPELSLDYINFPSFESYSFSMTTLVFTEINSLPDKILVAIHVLVPEQFYQQPELLSRICRDWRRIIRGAMCFRSTFCFQPGTPLSDFRQHN
ncbi:hypothetical protein R3P38DRAFT_3177213 [Favolaschia claudopus]|uniref:F-box domain-containing protein n=1 Tax=Favolaschia claudopus TaxID=2862362 RepID=A0AAW0D224_9AGAR